MSELGELLRRARMERGMSLDDLQESTKIRKRYLEAIEEGKYSVLPGNFYARAFIKQYSEAVGLDADEVLKQYASEIPAPEAEAAAEPVRMKRRSVNPPERSSRWASVMLIIAFPLLILGVIYYFSLNGAQPRDNVLENTPLTEQRESEQGSAEGNINADGVTPDGAAQEGSSDGTNTNPADPAVPDTQTEPEQQPPEPEEIVTFVENFRAGGAQAERYEVKSAGTVKVELKVVGSECWVGILKDSNKGDYVFQKGMAKEEAYVGEFDHNVFVNIGRADAIELKVNGVVIETGTEPDPRKFQFDLAAAVPSVE